MQLHAAPRADHEPNLIAVGGVAGQAEQASQERTRAIAPEFLKASREPVIDGDVPARRRHQPRIDARLLMREEALEPQAIVHGNVERAADDRRAVEIDRLAGGALEEITAEAVPTERGDLDGLGRHVRGQCCQANDRRNSNPSAHTMGV